MSSSLHTVSSTTHRNTEPVTAIVITVILLTAMLFCPE